MVTPYYEPVVGGITSFVRGLASTLRMKGVQVSIIANHGIGSKTVRIVQGGPMKFARGSAKVLRELRPDVIHAHAHWYALEAALSVDDGGATTFSFHSQWRSFGYVRRMFLARRLARCRSVTFPSQSLRAATALALPLNRVRVVHPGTVAFQADPERVESFRSLNVDPGWRAVIGYVGRFEWPRKVEGFVLLLEALTDPRLSDVGLVTLGGGKLLEGARARAHALGIGSRVRFLDNSDEPGPLYAACDVYCHPSLQEGMSLSLLEAMRAGAPIVGFRLPFMEEAIENGVQGLLVEPSSDRLADALVRTLADHAFARHLGTSAKIRAANDFDWSSVASQFLEAYGVRL